MGSFFGALIGGAFAEAQVSVFQNLFIVSAFSMLLSLFFYLPLFNVAEERDAFRAEKIAKKVSHFFPPTIYNLRSRY